MPLCVNTRGNMRNAQNISERIKRQQNNSSTEADNSWLSKDFIITSVVGETSKSLPRNNSNGKRTGLCNLVLP